MGTVTELIIEKRGLVEHNKRHKKLRLLVSRLNKERKKQAKRIDILCNDFIAAQRQFIKRLNTLSFKANFYEEIMGTRELSGLLQTTCKLIRDEIPDANVVFFLRRADSLELHIFESNQATTLERQHLENCFTPELVNNICNSNKLCELDDMFALGLQGNLNVLSKISAITIPLGQLGPSLGFILLYRSSDNKFTAEELDDIVAVTPGLSQAIQSRRSLLHSAG